MTAGKKEGWLLRLARRAGLEPVPEEVAARLAELQTTVEAFGKAAARVRGGGPGSALRRSGRSAAERGGEGMRRPFIHHGIIGGRA